MNRNLDENGFFFKRHLYRMDGAEPSYEEILGLVHTMAEKKEEWIDHYLSKTCIN